MKTYRNTVKIDGRVVHTTESAWPYQLLQDAKDAIGTQLYKQLGTLHTLAEKEVSTANLKISVECVCLVNRRAKRRAPDVIAAERAAIALKRSQKAAEVAKAKQYEEKLRIQRRQRITNQIDHAFKTGETGSESVAKYLTCEACDAPATHLYLNRAVPSGAAVLDENTVVGATCIEHANSSRAVWYRRADIVEFPVNRLEFFYSGIRQIGIK